MFSFFNKSSDKQLIRAIGSEDIEKLRFFFNAGVDPNTKILFRPQVITGFSYYISKEIIKPFYNEKIPLMLYSIFFGYTKIAKLIIENGIDINSYRGPYGNTYLFYAVGLGRVEIVSLLLEHGSDVNAQSTGRPINNRTVLDHAILTQNNSSLEIIKLLLSYGADLNYKNFYGSPALTVAAGCSDPKYRMEVIDLLLGHGSDVNFEDVNGFNIIDQVLVCYDDDIKMLFSFLLYGSIISENSLIIINGHSNYRNCLEAFKEIKGMPHLGNLIESYKNKNRGAILRYIDQGSQKNKGALIKEFQEIKEDYSSHESLSFIPERLFNFIKHTIMYACQQDRIASFKAAAFCAFLQQAVASKLGKEVDLSSLITDIKKKDYSISWRALALTCRAVNSAVHDENIKTYWKVKNRSANLLIIGLKDVLSSNTPTADLELK